MHKWDLCMCHMAALIQLHTNHNSNNVKLHEYQAYREIKYFKNSAKFYLQAYQSYIPLYICIPLLQII